MTPEGIVKDEVKAALRANNVHLFADIFSGKVKQYDGFFYMPVAGMHSVMGIHDFVGCWQGLFFSIETKAKLEKIDATPHQLAFQEAALSSGGQSYVGVRDDSFIVHLAMRVQEFNRG